MYRLKGRPTVFVATPRNLVAQPGTSQEPGLQRDGDRSIFVAAVLGTDGMLFNAAADSEELCWFQVAAYVADRLETRLWPENVTRVRALLDIGDYAGAAALYFECVGERWDEEWLVTARIDAHAGTGRSGVGRPDPDQSTAA